MGPTAAAGRLAKGCPLEKKAVWDGLLRIVGAII